MDLSKMPKSKSNFLAGVAAGIAEYQGVSRSTVRIFFVLTAVLTGGAGLILYTVLALLMPPPNQ